MSIRGWISNKIFDINGQVRKEVDNAMEDTFTYKIPGQEQMQDLLLKYRQSENLAWSRGNVNELSIFYSTYKNMPGELTSTSRQQWYEWASPIDNIPKAHFPTTDIIMGQMKSLLFSEELMIDVKTGNEDLDVTKNEELSNILEDNNLYELLQTGSSIETYSGTLGGRFIVNTEYEEFPIIKFYPAERLRFKLYMGRVQEVIFLDDYKLNKKVYTLRSICGKGYINYELVNERNKIVPLDTIEELANLKNVVFLGSNGKPIRKLMAVYKKNRSTSNEFPDSAYGGSDFEGLHDTFQMIDELYSTRLLYIRRTRPSQTLTEDLAPWDEKSKTHLIPKEYELDTVLLAATKDKNDNKGFQRDIVDFNPTPYMDAIKDELKSVWMKIGMAYTSVGLEAHSANISNAALLTKEKSTVIVRANKEKLWKKYLTDTFQLSLIYNSLQDLTPTVSGDTITYKLPDLFDYEYTIEFPEYSKQSFDERLDMAIKAIGGGAYTTEMAQERLFKDELTDKEKAVLLYKTKLENAVPIIEDEIPEDLETADTEQPLVTQDKEAPEEVEDKEELKEGE